MPPLNDIWKMMAGVAFFMLAMDFMENALHHLAGRKFKLFLKNQTTSRIKAISGGAIVTGLLQSSSIVNLLVLSMVGAGVVKMENALALMLGSNVGTTLNSWILATLGFNYNIELFVLPVAGIAGIGMAFSSKESKFYFWCKFFFSLAFLFVAMGFIKSGMEAFVQQTNLTAFNRYPVVVFLLLGIFLTALVQSGSVTIALTLSALYSNAISLYVAMAIVLGAEIGTTLKLFLASAKGVAVKKRVATGNFLFNLLTVIIIFFLLQPIHYGLVHLLKIRDHLIALVFFQTFVNIVSLMLFFPFLHLLGRFLLKHFEDNEEGGFYISKLPIADTTLAMDALENETRIFICDVVDFSLESFSQEEHKNLIKSVHSNFHRKTIAEKYEFIKKVHGEMHTYYLGIQKASTDKKETERLEQLISAIRNCMYAAKSIQDAQHDIEQVRNSSNDIKFGFYNDAGNKMLEFHRQILEILNRKPPGIHIFEDIAVLYRSITAGYADSLQLLYKESLATKVSEIEISTLINCNRELFTSYKSILFGLKDYLLTAKEADYFDSLPGFIR